jgi:ankyrin repeat protein
MYFPGQGWRYSSSLFSVWQLAYGCSPVSICWSQPRPREQQATITNTPRLCHRIHSVCFHCLYPMFVLKVIVISLSLLTHRAVEVMLKHNPNLIHLKNKEGCTPLHLAALNNHSSIVTCLLQYVSEVRYTTVTIAYTLSWTELYTNVFT